MQIAVENLEALERRMTITVPEEMVKSSYQKQINEVAKKARIDGFRPGKVPAQVVEAKYGKSVLNDVAIKLIETQFDEAIREKKIRIAGRPHIENFEIEKNQPFEFKATFEVYPEIDIKEFEGVSIEKETASVSDQDLAKMLENLQKQQATWKDVEREAKVGDQVVIDFEGSIDGNTFDGGAAKDFTIELGSNRMIPGFEDGIAGMKAGDVRDINVTFPEDYQSEDLKGKAAVFKITCHKVQEAELPPLDDELAKKMQVEDGFDALKAKAREGMERELDFQLRARLKEKVLDQLIALNEITVPKSLVDLEVQHLQQMSLQRMASEYGMKQEDLAKLELPKDPFIEQADKRVRLGLLLGEVIKKHDIKVDEEKVKSRVKEMASAYQKPEEVEAWYLGNKNALSEVEAAVIEETAVETLLGQATVTEKTLSYDEIIGDQK